MIQITHLIEAADAFCAARSVSLSTLSSRMFNDGGKLPGIKAGAGITVARYNAALVWLSNNWPENTAWPAGVDRPAIGADA